jgi:hypothetical protein
MAETRARKMTSSDLSWLDNSSLSRALDNASKSRSNSSVLSTALSGELSAGTYPWRRLSRSAWVALCVPLAPSAALPAASVYPSSFSLAASSESSSSSSLTSNWTCLSVLVRQDLFATHLAHAFGHQNHVLLFGGALLFLFSGCKLISFVNLGVSRLLCDAPGPHIRTLNLCLNLLVRSPLVLARVPLPFSEQHETQTWKGLRNLAF